MKSTVENLEPTKVKVTAEVPYEEFKPSVEGVLKEFAQQISIPGFRPGKAPARLIEQRVGRAAVMEEAVNHALPQLYADLIDENKLNPLGQPKVDIEGLPNVEGPEGGELTFSVTVEVRPEFDLPDLSSVTLEVASAKVEDADVQKELDDLRSRFATLTSVKRAIKKGDFVLLDMSATIDGEEIDNVTQISYEVGSGSMLEGMDEQLVGMKADETVTYTAPLAGGEHAGKDAEITLKPTAVKVQELPEADDEFAQMVSEFDTIEELRADLEKRAESEKAAGQAFEARDALLEKMLDMVDFPLPTDMLEEAVSARTDKDADEEKAKEVRESVERALRSQLLLDKLAEEKQVSVSQQELLEFVMQTSQAYGLDPSQFLGSAEANGQLPSFISEIARNKSLAQSLADVTVKDSDGKKVDLTEFIKDDSKETEAASENEADKAEEN
ncbi:MAG: trigger factor [Actinomycetaceae bacterium]|nr:trigger factor [Actinomycetaceae bacterium]